MVCVWVCVLVVQFRIDVAGSRFACKDGTDGTKPKGRLWLFGRPISVRQGRHSQTLVAKGKDCRLDGVMQGGARG